MGEGYLSNIIAGKQNTKQIQINIKLIYSTKKYKNTNPH